MSVDAHTGGSPAVFGSYDDDDGSGRRSWLVATFGSTAIYAAIVLLVVLLGSATKQVLEDEPVDVKFVVKEGVADGHR